MRCKEQDRSWRNMSGNVRQNEGRRFINFAYNKIGFARVEKDASNCIKATKLV